MAPTDPRWHRLISEHRERSVHPEAEVAVSAWGVVLLAAGVLIPWIPIALFKAGAEQVALLVAFPMIVAIGVLFFASLSVRSTQALAAGLVIGCVTALLLGPTIVA